MSGGPPKDRTFGRGGSGHRVGEPRGQPGDSTVHCLGTCRKNKPRAEALGNGPALRPSVSARARQLSQAAGGGGVGGRGGGGAL